MILIRWWLERRARFKILATFIEADGRMTTQLLSRDGHGLLHTVNPIMGCPEAYWIAENKITYSKWPRHLPPFLRIEVPSLFYKRGDANPFPVNGSINLGTIDQAYVALKGDEPGTEIDDAPQPLRRRFDFQEVGPNG